MPNEEPTDSRSKLPVDTSRVCGIFIGALSRNYRKFYSKASDHELTHR